MKRIIRIRCDSKTLRARNVFDASDLPLIIDMRVETLNISICIENWVGNLLVGHVPVFVVCALNVILVVSRCLNVLLVGDGVCVFDKPVILMSCLGLEGAE